MLVSGEGMVDPFLITRVWHDIFYAVFYFFSADFSRTIKSAGFYW